MKFTNKITCLLALAAPIFAANHNPVASPNWGATVNAGDVFPINWLPTTQNNVNLILREGDAKSLSTIYTIAANIPNSGSYSWEVPGSIVTRTDYTIEIQDASDPSVTNYSPYFRVLAVGSGITASEDDIVDQSKTVEVATRVSSIQHALHSQGYISSVSPVIDAVASESSFVEAAETTLETVSSTSVARETITSTSTSKSTSQTGSGSTLITTKTRGTANSTVTATSSIETASTTAVKTTTTSARSSGADNVAPGMILSILGAIVGLFVSL